MISENQMNQFQFNEMFYVFKTEENYQNASSTIQFNVSYDS